MPGIYRVKITAVTFSTFIFEDLGLTGGNLNLPDAMLRPGTAIFTIKLSAAAAELAGGPIATVGHVGIFGDVLLQDVPFSIQSYASTFLVNQQALTLTDVLGSDAAFVSPQTSSKASPYANTHRHLSAFRHGSPWIGILFSNLSGECGQGILLASHTFESSALLPGSARRLPSGEGRAAT